MSKSDDAHRKHLEDLHKFYHEPSKFYCFSRAIEKRLLYTDYMNILEYIAFSGRPQGYFFQLLTFCSSTAFCIVLLGK